MWGWAWSPHESPSVQLVALGLAVAVTVTWAIPPEADSFLEDAMFTFWVCLQLHSAVLAGLALTYFAREIGPWTCLCAALLLTIYIWFLRPVWHGYGVTLGAVPDDMDPEQAVEDFHQK